MEHGFFSDEDREETIRERKDRESSFTTGEDKVTVDHQPVPLFPGISSDPKRTVGYIECVKVDPPGDGYKGRLPPGTTHETISKMFGNGIYDLTCVAESGKILRRASGMKISIEWGQEEPVDEDEDFEETRSSSSPDMQLLHWQNDRHKEGLASFTQMMTELQKSTAAAHAQQLQLIQGSNDRGSQREQTFMTAMMTLMAQNNLAQQTFMAQQMAAAERDHQRTIERQRVDHDNTYRMMMRMQETRQVANDPQLFLQGMQQGMALLGAGDDDGEGEDQDDTPPWAQMFKAGAEAVKDITSTVKVKTVAEMQQAKRAAQPSETPENAPAKKPPGFARKRQTRSGITPNELGMIITAKQLCEQKKIPFAQAIQQFGQYLAEVPAGGDGDTSATAIDAAEEPTTADVVGG